MNDLRTHRELPRAARFFNLAVAALVFCSMLAFAGWVIVSGFGQPRPEIVRATGGTILAVAAVLLLTAVWHEWRSGEPFQHERPFILGIALVGIGLTVILAG